MYLSDIKNAFGITKYRQEGEKKERKESDMWKVSITES